MEEQFALFKRLIQENKLHDAQILVDGVDDERVKRRWQDRLDLALTRSNQPISPFDPAKAIYVKQNPPKQYPALDAAIEEFISTSQVEYDIPEDDEDIEHLTPWEAASLRLSELLDELTEEDIPKLDELLDHFHENIRIDARYTLIRIDTPVSRELAKKQPAPGQEGMQAMADRLAEKVTRPDVDEFTSGLSDLGNKIVERGNKALMDMPADEWQRLVDEANTKDEK